MAKYSETFKAEMVRRMSPPNAIPASRLAEEVGVHHSTLSRWRHDAGGGSLKGMKSKKTHRRPEDWTPDEKLAAVLEAGVLEGEALGSYLRRKGLHHTNLEQWRAQMVGGLNTPVRRSKGTRGKSPEEKKIRSLEKELRRKDAALAEAAALLVLSKKVEALWGDEDGSTARNKDEKSSN